MKADTPVLRSWHGTLTGETADLIAEQLRHRFEGDRVRYTMVHAAEFFGWRPEVRTGQRLRAPIAVKRSEDAGRFSVHIDWWDTYGSLLVLDSTIREGRHVDGYDHTRDTWRPSAAYVSFEDDRVKIVSTNMMGQLIYTSIVLEPPDAEVFDEQ